MTTPSRLLSTGQVARALGVSTETVRERVRSGALIPAAWINDQAGFDPSIIEEQA